MTTSTSNYKKTSFISSTRYRKTYFYIWVP